MHAGTPRQAHSAARRAGVGVAVALAWLALALPARADLPAPVAAALLICTDGALTYPARQNALEAAGWVQLARSDRQAAALAHAPWSLLSIVGLAGFAGQEQSDIAEDIAVRAEHLERIIAAAPAGDRWFALPGGAGFGRLVDPLGDGSAAHCELTGDVSADDVAAVLGLESRVIDERGITVTLFDLPADPSDRGAIVSHLRLAPETSTAAPIPQIIVTPRLPRPAPPGGASQ